MRSLAQVMLVHAWCGSKSGVRPSCSSTVDFRAVVCVHEHVFHLWECVPVCVCAYLCVLYACVQVVLVGFIRRQYLIHHASIDLYSSCRKSGMYIRAYE